MVDTITLVDLKIADGQRLLDRLAEGGFVVRAACWVKPVDDDRWSLYIVTPAVDLDGAAAAYRCVLSVLGPLESPWLKDTDIRLLGERQPGARDLLRQVHLLDTRVRVKLPILLGDVPVEEIYVYSLFKTKVEIFGSFFKGYPGGGGSPVTFSFEPFRPGRSLEEVGAGGQIRRYPADTSMSWTVAAPEGSVLENHDLLTWNLRGRPIRSSAQEVWSLAKLKLNGFYFLREPDDQG